MRRPYSTWARLINHPDAPLVRLRWFFTDLPFIDVPTVINSREWDTDDLRDLALGEVWGAATPYNGLERVPGLIGEHICGEAHQFIDGATWPPVSPPVEYGADWIPLCCPRSEVAQVAVGARPASTVTQGYVYRSALTVGARPASTVSMIRRVTAALTVGARPASTVTIIPAPDHPVTLGARPASTILQSYVTTARVTLGARPASYSAVTVFCPGPTSTCGAALLGSVGHNCEYEYAPLDTDSWRAWATAPGHAYRLHVESALGTYGFEIWEGTDCGDLTLIITGSMSSTPSDFDFATTSERVLVHWSYPFPSFLHVIIGMEDIT